MENAELIAATLWHIFETTILQFFFRLLFSASSSAFLIIILHSSFPICSPSPFFISVAAVFHRVLVFQRNLHVPFIGRMPSARNHPLDLYAVRVRMLVRFCGISLANMKVPVGAEQVSPRTPSSVFHIWRSACLSGTTRKVSRRLRALIASRGIACEMSACSLKILSFW